MPARSRNLPGVILLGFVKPERRKKGNRQRLPVPLFLRRTEKGYYYLEYPLFQTVICKDRGNVQKGLERKPQR